ncbi:MAG TPA: hypothetical protein VFD90_16545 [Gaiellales bacterium]|jgi:hypothetical protein|nr:hypothetical protein [Gaiellales bacterium]
MPRHALVVASLALVLAATSTEAGAAALKPLPVLNGVHCRTVINSSALNGYSCGRVSDLRSYVVTIEIAKRSPYGPRPSDQHLGSWVRSTRTGVKGNIYVMVVATRTDGNAKAARNEAAAAARWIARMNAA